MAIGGSAVVLTGHSVDIAANAPGVATTSASTGARVRQTTGDTASAAASTPSAVVSWGFEL